MWTLQLYNAERLGLHSIPSRGYKGTEACMFHAAYKRLMLLLIHDCVYINLIIIILTWCHDSHAVLGHVTFLHDVFHSG